jgi:hypothetical protein
LDGWGVAVTRQTEPMKLNAVPTQVVNQPSFQLTSVVDCAKPVSGGPSDLVELNGDSQHCFHKDAAGHWSNVNDKPGAANPTDLKKWLGGVFLPSNMPTSVSKDYLATRKWAFLHDTASNVGGFCAGAAIGGALGVNPIWGGAAMATFNLIRERACQATGFLVSFATPKADKNPRAWMLAGELMEQVGAVADAGAALVPGALLPLALTSGLMRTVANGMKGAAMANIGPRQAVADNLGEVGAKNGNQSFVACFTGAMLGLGLTTALKGSFGGALSPMVVAAGASLVATYAHTRFIKALDYHPINQGVIQDLVESKETKAQLAKPEPDKLWSLLPKILKPETIVLGQSIGPLLSNPQKFETLMDTYKDRGYILDAQAGNPYLVLKQDCTAEDKFAAAWQAAELQRLASSSQYQEVVKTAGQDQGDQWLQQQSFKLSLDKPQQTLEELKSLGWSSDALRFKDLGNRLAKAAACG